MKSRVLALLVIAALSAGCEEQVDPIPQPPLDQVDTAPASYDETLPPAAAVMALVPDDAATLLVTDFDQVRLVLGSSELTGASPRSERDRFWRRAVRLAPLLSPGQLRRDEPLLEKRFGFTQDDVAWEAHFTTPAGDGWVLKLRPDLPLTGVADAIEAGVPALLGGTLDTERGLVTVGTTSDPELSWAAAPGRLDLVGPLATSTYVAVACVPFVTAFGVDVEDELAPDPADMLDGLDTLTEFSVTFGGSLATARLGMLRSDVFDRARLADVLPSTDPEFGLGYADAVADPNGGRIGFRLEDAPLAAQLAVQQHLPFAVCAS